MICARTIRSFSRIAAENILPAPPGWRPLPRKNFSKSLLAFAERWVLDQGNTIALWGARHPDQLKPIDDIMGWHIDDLTMGEVDGILQETITDPVGPEFMAPPQTKPA